MTTQATPEPSTHLPPLDHPCPCGFSFVAHHLSGGGRLLAFRLTAREDYVLALALDERDVVNPFVTVWSDSRARWTDAHHHRDLESALRDLAGRAEREARR